MKQATSLLTQEFNATLNKEREYNTSALAEAETLKVRMEELDNTMALITKKLIEPGTGDSAQGP